MRALRPLHRRSTQGHGRGHQALRVLIVALLLFGCASGGAPAKRDNYLRYVTVELPGHEHVTLRWQKRKMPLKIHLPKPLDGFVSDPQAVWESVRDGVTDWTDVAAPGIPSFLFVDDPGSADIPIVWERKSLGGDRWYIAYAAADIDVFAQRFGIAHILVTARRENGNEPSLGVLYETVLHEMGHALGLAGHSPDQGDIMYSRIMGGRDEGLSARDRETLRLLYKRPNGQHVAGARQAD